MRGGLLVFLHDWNGLGRSGILTFEGERFALGDHAAEGRWVRFEVAADQTRDGRLELKAEPSSGPNIMVSRIVCVGEGE